MEINREELAWAAGFYDGEGHISHTTRTTPKDYIKIAVAQSGEVCPPVLLKFQKIVGMGHIFGPYTRKTKGLTKKSFWTWQIADFEHCQAVIAMLWLQLSDYKKEQARIALGKYRAKELKNQIKEFGYEDPEELRRQRMLEDEIR